jgi:uncharacterized membrane protein HdeD (DUF308 family)
MEQVDIFVAEAPGHLVANWGWFIALGIGLIILGTLAIWRARTATLLYVTFLGVVFLIASLALLVFTFSLTGQWSGFFLHLLWAILLGVIGLILVTRPSISAEAITLFLAFYLLTTGLIGIAFALYTHVQGEGFYVLEGLASAILGALLLAGWPVTGLFAIGLFVGIAFVFRGISLVALALTLRFFT